MSFYGDLSSIAIGDLFQNFETNRSTGTFTLSGEREKISVYFLDGACSMVASENRPSLMDSLVASGVVTAAQMKAARTRRKGSRRSMAETLVALKVVSEEQILSVAQTVLQEDVCDLFAGIEGHFEFREGKPPARLFDPEERRLGLRIPVGPLLLEAARRADHWEQIRKVITSDSVHYVAPAGMECPPQAENPELVGMLLPLLDGTRNVQEVTALFRHLRFAAYQQLAQLVRERLVRAVEGDDLVTTARATATTDPKRARRIIARGLEAQPQHEQLLTLEATLAEELKDPEGAAAALKMLAHLKLGGEEKDEARGLLERARDLSPSDTAIWERLVSLDLDAGRKDEAVVKGMELVNLYRAPGLHAKAREVLDRLVEVSPQNADLHLERARCVIDAGDPKTAVTALNRVGKRLISVERYSDAKRAFSAILAVDPDHAEAKSSIEAIEGEVYTLRKARRQHFRHLVGATVLSAMVVIFIFLEITSRIDYVHATSEISRDRLIEEGRYKEAMLRYESVKAQHPYSTVTLFDIQRRLRDLKAKKCATQSPGGGPKD